MGLRFYAFIFAAFLVALLSSPFVKLNSGLTQLAQYEQESASQRARDLERPSNRQQQEELGDRRQRDLEDPDQDAVEDPDNRQQNIEQGDQRQRELEGRD